MIQFTIPGQPMAKARPRFRIMPPKTDAVVDQVSKSGFRSVTDAIRAAVSATMKGAFVSTYTDSSTVENENRIAAVARAAMRGIKPMESPLEVLIELRMQIPVSWSKKKRVAASEGKVRATKKPDIDNVVKSILDASNGIVWIDDAQVVVITVRKLYHAEPCVVIAVRPVEGEAA
ncbi:MAG: RusA family crossover junction endodeoxyribonuclease [Pseudomonadota bacterium]